MVIFTLSLNTDTYYFGKWRPLTPTDVHVRDTDILTSVHKLTRYLGRRALPSTWPQSDLKSLTCVSKTHTHTHSVWCTYQPPLHWQHACQSGERAVVLIPLHMTGRQETSRVKWRINSPAFVGGAQAHVGTGHFTWTQKKWIVHLLPALLREMCGTHFICVCWSSTDGESQLDGKKKKWKMEQRYDHAMN